MKEKAIVARNPKELMKVLGLNENDLAEIELRSSLNDKIISLAKKSSLSHEKLAKLVGTSRPRITALLNRSRSDLSTDFMVRVLSALGYKVTLKVSKIAS